MNTKIQKTEDRRQKTETGMQKRVRRFSPDLHPSSFIPHPSIRRGSILILVIALLVMLALIGTAFISTTRLDRTAAAQASANTELDLFTSSVQNQAVNVIVDDMFKQGELRTPTAYTPTPATTAQFNPVTSPVTSTFLASRIPSNPAGAIQWDWISNPLTDGDRFEDPTVVPGVPATPNVWGGNAAPNDRNNVSISASGNNPALVVGGRTLVAGDADGDGIADCGLVPLGFLPGPQFAGIKWYYGVRIIDGNSAINATTAWTMGNDGEPTSGVIAGSTTANLRNNRLTPASIGLREMLTNPAELDFPTGLTQDTLNFYRFGGIDPGTIASNAPLTDYDNTTDVVRASRMRPIARADFNFLSQMDAFWSQLGSRPGFPGYAQLPVVGAPIPPRFQGLSDSDTAALAYRFCLINPNNPQITSNPSVAYKSAPSVLEQKLHTDLYNITSPNYHAGPYSAGSSANWFNQNFNFAGGSMLRTLIVGRNPVLNVAASHTPLPPSAPDPWTPTLPPFTPDGMSLPSVETANIATTPPPKNFTDRGAWQATVPYAQGDVVQASDFTVTPKLDSRTYVCIVAVPTPSVSTPSQPPDVDTGHWRPQDWSLGSAKVNVNTASFRDLWRAYWNVMVNDPNPTIGTASYSPFDFGGNPIDPTGNGTTAVTINGTNLYYGNTLDVPPTGQQQHPERMFRSPVRWSTANSADPFLSSQDMVLLRSAIAAANAEHMRDYSQNPNNDTIKVHTIKLNTTTFQQTGGAAASLQADVYATGIQPFISEVYVDNDIESGNNSDPFNVGVPNPDGYVGIELYNPYNVAIDLANWAIVIHDRTVAGKPWRVGLAAASTNNPPGTFIFGQGGNNTGVIPAHGYVLLENFSATAQTQHSARHRPSATNLPAQTTPTTTEPIISVPELSQVMGHEMILLRPLDGAVSTGATPTMTSALPAQVPVDSFDFTGFQPGTALMRTNGIANQNSPPAQAFEYYYARQTSDDSKVVYPGHYNGTSPLGTPREECVAIQWVPAEMTDDPNNPGTKMEVDHQDPWTGAGGVVTAAPQPNDGQMTVISNGGNTATQNYTITFGFPANRSVNIFSTTSKVSTIQLGGTGTQRTATLTGFGGPHAAIAATLANRNYAPFGNFMREGDLMQIPFIGAYVIYDQSQTGGVTAGHGMTDTANQGVYEINSVSMDCAFADDTDPNDDNEENIGRFCPIVPAWGIPSGGTVQTDISEFSGKPINLRYGWASKLFDYLTVRGNPRTPDANLTAYLAKNVTGPDPQATPRTPDAAKGVPSLTSEEPHTIDGLININTAPAEVLRRIPWVMMDSRDVGNPSTNPNSVVNATAANLAIANAIVAYRNSTYGSDPVTMAADHMEMTAGTKRYFHNLFELNKVMTNLGAASFRTNGFAIGTTPPWGGVTSAWGTESHNPESSASYPLTTPYKTHDNGDFTPTNAPNPPTIPDAFTGRKTTGSTGFQNDTADGIANDFESQFLQLTAVSNLITTRSDTFTVYIVIEGWANAGTANATRVAQHRLAFLVDRTGVTSSNNRAVRITPVPTD